MISFFRVSKPVFITWNPDDALNTLKYPLLKSPMLLIFVHVI